MTVCCHTMRNAGVYCNDSIRHFSQCCVPIVWKWERLGGRTVVVHVSAKEVVQESTGLIPNDLFLGIQCMVH